jgi:uncharacterized membrane protein
MTNYLLLYVGTVPVFFIIDMLWLGLIANSFYQTKLASLLGPVQWPVAIGFYLVFIVGIILFAVHPALQNDSLRTATLLGAAFGFFTYATYDLTNLSTLKDWPVSVAIVDIMWGTVLSASVATISYLIAKTWIF